MIYFNDEGGAPAEGDDMTAAPAPDMGGDDTAAPAAPAEEGAAPAAPEAPAEGGEGESETTV